MTRLLNTIFFEGGASTYGSSEARMQSLSFLRKHRPVQVAATLQGGRAQQPRIYESAGETVTRLLNTRYEAWDGDLAVTPPRNITSAGLIVHATKWGGLPGVPSKADSYAHWRDFVSKHAGLHMARNEADGLPAGDTPVSLTLLNRGLTRLIGSNEVACCSTGKNASDFVQGAPRDVPGQILLAAGELTEGSVRCAFVRDGMSNVRERGCGCMQSLERQGRHSRRQHQSPAILMAVNMTQHRSRLDSPSRIEVPFYAREQWGRCQPGGNFYCDALRPKGMHRSATDGSCVVRAEESAARPMRRARCGSSMCAWRPGQGTQLLAAQVAAVSAIKSGRFERIISGDMLSKYPALAWGRFFPPSNPNLYNEVVTSYREMVPSINAVLVMSPKAGTKGDRVSIRTAHSAARAVGAARGRHIPVLCLRRSPRPGEDAVVPLDQCAAA